MSQTLLGGGSPLNKFKEIDKHLSRNSRTVYVELDGDDVKGDGSIGKPFKTLTRALDESVGTTRKLEVTLGAGTHVVAGVMVERCHVTINGEGELHVTALDGQIFEVNSAILDVNVDVTDVSENAYSRAGVCSDGALHLSDMSLRLKNATAFLSVGWGHNSLVCNNASISSNSSIVKFKSTVNSEAFSVYENSTTYSKITG